MNHCITEHNITHTSRRKFLQMTGCLAIGFNIEGFSFDYPSPFAQELPESLKRNPNINAWMKLLELASLKLAVSIEQLSIDNGKIGVKTGSHNLTFSGLLEGKQITDEVR